MGMLHMMTTGKDSSWVIIPFIGPITLDVFLLIEAKPLWSLAIPWMLDAGTLNTFMYMPRLFRDWWKTSCFTRLCTLTGSRANQHVQVSLHKGNQYCLRFRCEQRLLSTLGSFEAMNAGFRLTSQSGEVWRIEACADGYIAADPLDSLGLSMDGLRLHCG
jgi:hypothetical protein